MNCEEWNTWCNDCQWKAKVVATQPYRDWTWRIEIHCINHDCEEHGIICLIEVPVKTYPNRIRGLVE